MLVYIQLALLTLSTLVASIPGNYDVKPFTVNFPPEEVSRMITLAESTRLPHGNQFAGGDNLLGISRDTLQDLKQKWADEYSWEVEAEALNKSATFIN
jgi:hypothetical protein